MEIKITLKNGEKSGTFKFAGDPVDIVTGLAGQVSGAWGTLCKLIEDDKQT